MVWRVKLLAIFFTIGSLFLVGRLFFWQVIKAGSLSTQARLQYQSGVQISAQRGSVLASDGTSLAASRPSWLLYADSGQISDNPREIANRLVSLLVDKEDVEEGKLDEELLREAMRLEGALEKKAAWIPLKHNVAPETKRNIEALEIGGLHFDSQEERFYPEASAAAQVLGFVGKSEDGADTGYFGLEGFYDLSLAGKSGFVQRESDARGTPLLFGDSKRVEATQGVDLLTHIDKTVQKVVEENLETALTRYGAVSGTVVVMDPVTGAVLAMASNPSYDPASYFEYGNSFFKNPAISDSFEPGSIFKPLVMAAALDADVIEPDTKCDVCDGPIKVEKYEIETWDKNYHEEATMTEVIVNSDNVGMVFVGNKLGKEKMFDYLSGFGLGEKTDIDLQGEGNSGIRAKGEWNIVDLATSTFGQGIATTPIQMLAAISTVANGGELVTPQVVDKIKQGDWEHDIPQETKRRVISKEAAKQATEMMVAAVKNGESKWTQAIGFKIAGKTGTAQIPVEGHYDEEKTIVSFVGFAPADNPKFAMLVTLREPTSSPWGSETAAPLWFNIARELFPYMGIQPED